ncbi:MAG: hypothetical protein JNJ59_20235, partial [Deltaproteobacteria bacterium]|nr:hypothetical protein [Deltaproteobacteria bacterium]
AAYSYGGGNPVASVDPEGDILFSLFVKPWRKKSLPYRDREGGGGAGGGGRAEGANAGATPQATAPKQPAALTKHLVPRLEKREAKLKILTAQVKGFPKASPGESPFLTAERKSLEKQRNKLSKRTERLRKKIYPAQSNGLGYILPDVLLVTTVVGAVLGGVAYGTGVFDSDSGSEESAPQDPPSQSFIFGGN